MNSEQPKPPFWIRVLVRLEALQDRLGHRLAVTAEILDWTISFVFAKLGDVLFAPVRRLFRSRLFVSTQKAQDDLAVGAASVTIRIRDFLSAWTPRIFPPQLFWPFYWVYDRSLWILDFFLAWLFTRNFSKLIRALPAAILSVPLIGALVLGTSYSPAAKIRHYESARRQALQDKDEARADFLLVRLNQLGYQENDRAEFERAIASLQEQEDDDALSALEKLAPTAKPGYAPAHLYLAAAMIDGKITAEDPWSLIRTHTQHALELEPNHPMAQRFLVECQLHDEEFDLAAEGMEALRKIFPDFNAELAHHHAHRGDPIVAKKYARAAIKYLETIQAEANAAASPAELQITAQGYLRMAEAYAIDGQPERELKLLRNGAETHRDSEINQLTYVHRLEKELHDFSFSNSNQREYLKQLLITDPSHETGLRLLFRPITAGNADAKQVANELLQDQQSPAQLLKAIGDMYLANDQLAVAKQAYQSACKKDVQSAYAWNNLAWIWSNSDPIDMEMALRCADKAMKAKRDPNFFETRGQILVKLERFEEAAHYLERALNASIPNPEDAHRSLATIYTALGKSEKAAAHKAASGQ